MLLSKLCQKSGKRFQAYWKTIVQVKITFWFLRICITKVENYFCLHQVIWSTSKTWKITKGDHTTLGRIFLKVQCINYTILYVQSHKETKNFTPRHNFGATIKYLAYFKALQIFLTNFLYKHSSINDNISW